VDCAAELIDASDKRGVFAKAGLDPPNRVEDGGVIATAVEPADLG
jgi:hypothetical protein